MNIALPFLRQIIREGIKQALSGNRILRTLREHGVKIRTQTFYQYYREELKAIEMQEVLPYINPLKKIPDYLHIKTPDRIPSRYKYIVSVLDEFGNWITYGIYSDIKMSVRDVIREAKRMAIEEYEIEPLQIIFNLAVKRL